MASVSTYGDPRHLLPNNYKALISAWLEEDCPSFDYGGFVVGESDGEARLLGKSAVRIASDCFFLIEANLRRELSREYRSSTRSFRNLAVRTFPSPGYIPGSPKVSLI